MQFISKYTLWAAATLAVVVFLAYVFFFNTGEALVISQNMKSPHYLVSETIPVAATGIVEAADQAIISAQTGGVIEAVYVHEGELVQKHSPLVRQSNPVAGARLLLSDAERKLTSLTQQADLDSKQKLALQAGVRTYSAEEIARLRTLSDDRRTREVAGLALTTIEQNMTVALQAFSFVDTHKSYFDSQALELYRELLADLYGRIPKQFQTNVGYGVKSAEDIIDTIRAIRESNEVSIVEVQNISSLVHAHLKSLAYLYTTSEREFFDKDIVDPDGAEFSKYITNRESVLSNLSQLEMSVATFNTVVDATLEDDVVQNQQVMVTQLDEAVAQSQSIYSAQIGAQADVVAQAFSNVSSAEISLSNPTAPFSGEVADVFVDVGEYVAMGQPILSVVGEGARELHISVPLALAKNLEVGQSFFHDGKIAGFVDRFSNTAYGNSVAVVITLTEGEWAVGQSVRGSVMVKAPRDIYAVPRSFVHFDSEGPYLVFEIAQKKSVEILHDQGDTLFVLLPNAPQEALVATSGFTFES